MCLAVRCTAQPGSCWARYWRVEKSCLAITIFPGSGTAVIAVPVAEFLDGLRAAKALLGFGNDLQRDDLTLDELKGQLGTSLGRSTLCRALQSLRLTLKKKF